jgi:hypothetical protein
MSVEIVPRKHFDFRTYLAKKARAKTGTCAKVQFHDYGTELWSHGNRNRFRKAL